MNQNIKLVIDTIITYLLLIVAVVLLGTMSPFVSEAITFYGALIKHHPVAFVIILLVGAFLVAWIRQLLPDNDDALMATAALLPGAAALSTVLIFLTRWPGFDAGEYAPYLGLSIGLVFWLILSRFCYRFTKAEFAVPSSYDELQQRLAQLNPRLEVGQETDPRKKIAYDQARAQVEKIKEEFKQSGLSWASARGYINAWNRLHRAEEAMIEVAPQETVVAGALNDVLRLKGSNIDHSEELIGRLRQAIEAIDPSVAKDYLQGAGNSNSNSNSNSNEGAPADNSNQQAQARAVLRDVRCAINEFRDGCWNGLIVVRNRLIAVMIFTGMTAFTLLAIAIIGGVQKPAIIAASAFYLVGATIGLLNQLRSASQTDTAVEDYGLSTARLITMPLICGLAAIGGVALMAMMPQAGNSSSSNTAALTITTPSNLAAGVYEQLYHQRVDATGGTPPYSWLSISDPGWMELKATGDLIAKVPKRTELTKPIKFTAQVEDSTGVSVPKTFYINITSAAKGSAVKQPSSQVAAVSARSLEDIFDLHKNMFGLFLAAVFGFTPGLLFDRLQQQSEKYKTKLNSSEVTQGNQQTQK